MSVNLVGESLFDGSDRSKLVASVQAINTQIHGYKIRRDAPGVGRIKKQAVEIQILVVLL
jgi:hypothetical protein